MRSALLPGTRMRDLCEEELFSRARQSALADLKAEEPRDRVGLLAGSLMLAAVTFDHEEATYARMHKSLVRLLQIWPSIAHEIRDRFEGWHPNLPLVRLRGYWELEMTLRAFL